jgi:hypothetical protein
VGGLERNERKKGEKIDKIENGYNICKKDFSFD